MREKNWRPPAEHSERLREIQEMYDPGKLEALYAIATEAERRHREQMYKASRDRERILSIAYNQGNTTFKEVGERFGLSEQRVSQLVQRFRKRKAEDQ